MKNRSLTRGLMLVPFLAASVASHAAAVDVGAVTTDIGAQIASVVAVGAAVLIVFAAVKAFKWVRAAMS